MAYHIAVVGGGAAGLTAAITAARTGARVTVLEHMDRVGKKILSTGNGRCNYTNAAMTEKAYYSGAPQTVRFVLDHYPVERILSFFEEIGVEAWQKEGYYYPASGQASAVLDCLRDECSHLGVEIRCGIQIQSIARKAAGKGSGEKQRFLMITNEGNMEFDRVILACGGQAAPFTGSDGSGYELAKSFGHHICTPFPALTGLKSDPRRFKSLAGIRARAKVSLYVDGHLQAEDTGELQLTENGLSGIVIFQISHPAIETLRSRKQTEIRIHFLPELSRSEVFDYLKYRQKLLGHKELSEWGTGLLNKKLWLQLIRETGLSSGDKVGKLDDRALRRLQTVITDFRVPINGYLGFDRAQVTAGGVDLREIEAETMESKKVPGLYMAGEMLDVDGICGGYNLHWAWASGMLAAESACRR